MPDFISHRAGEPWSIWVADAASGAARRVWVSDAGDGQRLRAHALARQFALEFTRRIGVSVGENRLAAALRHRGARRRARAVTHGAIRSRAHGLESPTARRLVYSSNEDIDRMHVWTRRLQGRCAHAGEQGPRDRGLPADQRRRHDFRAAKRCNQTAAAGHAGAVPGGNCWRRKRRQPSLPRNW